jgi:phenylacetate-CoA ligase
MKNYPPIGIALRTAGKLGRRSLADVENFRDRRIRALVTHAYENVPFYRRLYDEHGVRASMVRGTADLPMLPRITKHDLQSVPVSERIASGLDISRLHMRCTTGTTGEPLEVYRTPSESRVLGLYYFQAFRSLGVRRSDLAAGIALPRPGEVHRYPFFRRVANRAGLFPVANVLAENAADALAEFKRLRPSIIGGIPGRISLFAASWTEAEKEFVRNAPWPRLIITGGERLKHPVRSHLSHAFGARVFDMYSNVEFHLIASECPSTGEYHVSDETVAMEILDGDKPVSEGETGQPVMTALHQFASPLIRYEISDRVTKGKNVCDCGVSYSTIKSVHGRSMDFFTLPDGSVFHDVKLEEAVAFSAPWARQLQVRQQYPDHIVIKLAPFGDVPDGGVEKVRTYLANFMSNRATVDVVIEPSLGPAPHEAKFRSMIRARDAEPTTR